jgi:Uma2 family endonuclease
MLNAVQTRMTATEYFQLPETLLPTELINGDLLEMPAPVPNHQRFSGRVYKVVDYLKPNGEVFYAPADIYLDEINIVQPDIFWIAENGKCIEGEKYFRGAPDLVVEVLSPGTTLLDKRDKFLLYEKYGVREYWMLHPTEHYAEIWQLQAAKFVFMGVFGADDTFASSILGQPVVMTAIFGEAPKPES